MKATTIILDPAHGSDVPGKCSPDKRHIEWKWSREVCGLLSHKLSTLGFRTVSSNPTERETGFGARLNAMNSVGGLCFVLSIHTNAAGSGNVWMNASGMEFFTTPGKTKSDECATILYAVIHEKFPNIQLRKDTTDGDDDKEASFAVLKSKHPSVLCEILFHDNRDDVGLLEDDSFISQLVDALANACVKIDLTLNR